MISETFFEEPLQSYLNGEKNKWLNSLTPLRNLPPIPTNLVTLLEDQKQTAAFYSRIASTQLPRLSFDAVKLLDDYYDNLEKEEARKRSSLEADSIAKKTEAEQAHAKEVEEVNSYNDSLLQPMREKQQELLAYSDSIRYIFDHYNITALDVSLPDDMQIEDYCTAIDAAIAACQKYKEKGDDQFNKLMSVMDGETNLAFTGSILLICVVLLYFCLPLICVPIFAYTFTRIHNMYNDTQTLQLASVLMSEANFERFVPSEQFKEVKELDTKKYDAMLQEELKGIKSYDTEREEAKAALMKKLDKIRAECDAVENEIKKEYAECTKTLQDRAKVIEERIAYLKSNMVCFPNKVWDHLYMSPTYTVGRIDDCIDATIDMQSFNMVFDAKNRQDGINRLKLYLCNMLLSVRVKQLVVEIYDPQEMCKDFTEFLTIDTKDYIKANSMDLNKLMEKYRKIAQENVIDLGNKPANLFNKDAEERELVPKVYSLLILVSNFGDLVDERKKDDYYKFLQMSQDQGVIIWMLDTKPHPGCTWVDDAYTLKGKPIQYTRELGVNAVSTYVNALQNYKEGSIDYAVKMGDKYIPYDKWWTFDTIKGIKMPYGLEKGDPTRGLNVAPEIGDANVHAILGGATGAGKSATINQLLMSLITMYPPSELMIVYIDFKNVEAAKFTSGYDKDTNSWMDPEEVNKCNKDGIYYNRVSRIPHLRIISGTTDGEYALSVFEFLMEEMQRRQGIINRYGHDQTKIEGVRKSILAEYNAMKNDGHKYTWAEMRRDWEWYKPNVYDVWGDLPRLLVIFDEFQVMYNPEYVDARTVDKINGKITAITKLARAMGAHFWFTSQSMKGTMSKDTMANFSLRGALRCTTEVSEELLGNSAAGTITQKFGYMYTNDSAGTDKTANRLWRVPFLSEDDMSPKYIDKLFPLLEKFNEKHHLANFYDEKVLVPATVMNDWYKLYPDTFAEPRSFIVGERANFSTNNAPVTMTVVDDTSENVLIAASERADLLNLVLMAINNIKHKENTAMLIQSQDKDCCEIIDLPGIVGEKYAAMSSPKQDPFEFLNMISSIISSRLTKEGPFQPLYVILLYWERVNGLTQYRNEEQLKAALRDGPTVGVHFIIGMKEVGDMPKSCMSLCAHKLTGLITKDAFRITDNNRVEKLPDASKDAGLFAFYEFGQNITKFRIYQHVFAKEIKSRDIVIN